MNWSDKKVKAKSCLGWFEINFVQYTFFFPTCQALITWFELSRVKLYRNDIKGKKILRVSGRFEYRGFESPGVLTVKVRRGNRLWFELARIRGIESHLYI